MRLGISLFALLVGGPSFIYAQQPAVNPPEMQGHADRVSFETWFSTLSGDQRRGAEFWAQERSKPRPVSCLATDGSSASEFVAGCQEAQRRLALPDVRRRTEPDYRKGWNADIVIAEQARPSPAQGIPEAASGRPDAAPVTSSSPSQVVPPSAIAQSEQKTDQVDSQVFSGAIGLPVSEIEAEYPGTDCSGDMCEFAPNHTPQSFCPKAGNCNNLVLFVKDGRIIGYTAEFSLPDWTNSLNTSVASLGQPKKETKNIKSRSSDAAQFDYWSWQISGDLELTYTAASGVNVYGAPIDDYSIMISPSVDGKRK